MPLVLRSEQSADLTPEQVDDNFTYLDTRITNALDELPAAPYVSNVIQSGLSLTFVLSDATTLPAVTIPVAAFSNRGDWVALTSYFVNDIVRVRGTGWYLVHENHTSAAEFDPDAGSGETYSLLFPDPTPALPLDVSDTAVDVTAADHKFRYLRLYTAADITLPDEGFEDGDEVHFINKTGGTSTFNGTGSAQVSPPDGFDAAVSTNGGVVTAKWNSTDLEWELFGALDPVSV